MTVKEIFIEKLKRAGYLKKDAIAPIGFDSWLHILENDRENVFKAMYGEKLIKNRGTKPMKEWSYRLLEAERDIKQDYIKITMHYLLMQIKVKMIKI